MTTASRDSRSSSSPRRGPGPGRGPGGMPIESVKDFKQTTRRLFSYFKKHTAALVVTVFLVIGYTLLGLINPILLGQAIDQFINVGNIDGLGRIALLMLAVFFGSSLLQFIASYIMAGVSQGMLKQLRKQLFDHLQTLSLKYFDQNQVGDLMSRLTNDIDAINRAISQNVTQLIGNLLTVVGVVVVMLSLNLWLTLASMIVTPIMFLVTTRIAMMSRKNFRKMQSTTGALNAVMEETISGQRAVKIFRQNRSAMDGFVNANREVRDVSIRALAISMVLMPLMNIMSNMDVAVVMGIGGWLAVSGIGGVSVGLIATFVSYVQRFTDPLRSLSELYNSLQSALAGAERVFKVLDTAPDLTDLPDAKPIDDLKGEVVFDHVDFSYVDGVPVMKQVNMHALPGQTIALVGPTGAGKTTTINLLSRFYDVNGGTIYIDGDEIKTLKVDDLRRSLGIVLQDNFLFSGTVMENIRYGRLEATDEEVYQAARLANAETFIHRLPEGYQTQLSERGSNLSQGQRQLLSIARAILANPKILILDEATSSVDTRTEKHIQEALLRLMEGRTAFVIAHRLSTIRNADQVLVINGGEVIERGTHDELLAQKGFYYNLYISQFKGKTQEELGLVLN
ncbi:MAG: ABC transporter ATP-binding protein [Anaerolineae bacterium]|nr:ABC transporter ATP-binding protein [Anaerolineae bacterium]